MRAPRRPRLAEDDSSVAVSFRLTTKQYDRTKQEADRERLPVAAWLRRVVEEACKPRKV
jgi:hypothetical protein